VVIGLQSGEVHFAKQYYKIPEVVANYTRALLQLQQVITSGKPISEAPVPNDKSPEWNEIIKKVVNFEGLMANLSADVERGNDVNVGQNFHILLPLTHPHDAQSHGHIKIIASICQIHSPLTSVSIIISPARSTKSIKWFPKSQ
jgi:hypothetical protein